MAGCPVGRQPGVLDAVPDVHLGTGSGASREAIPAQGEVAVPGGTALRCDPSDQYGLVGIRGNDGVLGDRRVMDVVLQQQLRRTVVQGVVATKDVPGDGEV